MAIINISRQIGSLGDEIADRTAQRMGYQLFDKDEINAMVSNYAGDFSEEMDIISTETKPGFFNQILRDRSLYSNLVRAIIYDIASRDNVVIRGRGGNFLFTSHPEVLNVRIFAPVSTRITRIQANQPTRSVAEDIVKQSDESRSGFVQYLFRHKVEDPNAYDILINTEKIDVPSAVDILANRAKFIDRNHPVTEKFSSQLKRLALGKRIKATIQKEKPGLSHLTVSVEIDDSLTLAGIVTSEDEKTTIERYARVISEGMIIRNEIIVARPSHYRQRNADTH